MVEKAKREGRGNLGLIFCCLFIQISMTHTDTLDLSLSNVNNRVTGNHSWGSSFDQVKMNLGILFQTFLFGSMQVLNDWFGNSKLSFDLMKLRKQVLKRRHWKMMNERPQALRPNEKYESHSFFFKARCGNREDVKR